MDKVARSVHALAEAGLKCASLSKQKGTPFSFLDSMSELVYRVFEEAPLSTNPEES